MTLKIPTIKNTDKNFPSLDLLQQLLTANTEILTDETEHLACLMKIFENPYTVLDEFLNDTILLCKQNRKKFHHSLSECEYWLTQHPSTEHQNLLEKNIACISQINKLHDQALFLAENCKKYSGVNSIINALNGGAISPALPKLKTEHLQRLKIYVEKYHLKTTVADIHGFLTGIISIPYTTSPVKWLDYLGMTASESQDEMFSVCEALMILYADIIKNMRSKIFTVERFLEQAGHQDSMSDAKERWALWYMVGVFLESDKWKRDENFTSLFFLITALGSKGDTLEKKLGATTAQSFKDEGAKHLSDIAMKIYAHSHPQSSSFENPLLPSQKKIKQSRNAPCQCNSGKKFKHCCLN